VDVVSEVHSWEWIDCNIDGVDLLASISVGDSYEVNAVSIHCDRLGIFGSRPNESGARVASVKNYILPLADSGIVSKVNSW